jgi:predicted TIM-barrel fold metal-dependent hydrolase
LLITDSQIHLWEPDRSDRPWPAADRVAVARDSSYSVEQMLPEMERAGVDRAVIVPPSWIGENNATALEAAARYPERFAVMGRFDPMAPDARERLETWLSQPHMLGIRMTFLGSFTQWLEDGSIEWFWSGCERLGIPVMVLVAGICDKIVPTAARHPGLRLIIDHMACDLRGKAETAFVHFDDLLSLAAFPEVRVKVSSAPCFSAEPYPFRDLEPFLRRIYEAFGARRLMWGADLAPRLTCSYKECLDHFASGLPFLTAEDRERILGGTTAETLNWPEQKR